MRCGFPRGPNSKKPFVSLHLEEGRREEGRRFAVIIDSSLAAALQGEGLKTFRSEESATFCNMIQKSSTVCIK